MKRHSKNCINPDVLELFVLKEPSPPGQEKQIRTHLAACEFCRTLVDDIAEFYTLAEAVPASSIDRVASRLSDRAKSIRRPRMIILAPVLSEKSGTHRYLLAAAGKQGPRYETVQSYVNIEQDVIARVIRDNVSKQLTLYWVEEGKPESGERMLEIEGSSQRFALDPAGRIPLVGISELDIKKKMLRLLSPIAVFDLEPVSSLKEKVLLEGRFQLENADFDRIQIEVEENGGRTVYKIRVIKLKEDEKPSQIEVLVSEKEERLISSPAHRGVAVFEELDLEKILKIRIY